MPAVGERRQINGQWAEWDGNGWLPAKPPNQGILSSLRSIASPEGLQALKRYGGELVSGEGTARKEAGKYGAEELKGFGSALNPVNIVSGLVRMATTNPVTTAKEMGGSLYDAATGDPRALGATLGTVVAPKLYSAGLRAVNQGAEAVANSPSAQRGTGYIGGAAAGIATGSHPFIMGRVGQAAAPLIGKAARGVADASGRVMDAFGMREPPVIDRYAPNTSGYSAPDPREPPVSEMAPELPPPISQGVYVEMPDGSWGVKALPGHKLFAGEPVNVMNRAGQAKVITVGRVGPDGVAPIAEPALPQEITLAGKRIDPSSLAPAVREQIMEFLKTSQ